MEPVFRIPAHSNTRESVCEEQLWEIY